MEAWHWVTENGFTLLDSAGITGGLLFTAFSLRSEARSRRIANLLEITRSHRDIWRELLRTPALARVTDPHADLVRLPVTAEEELFVRFLVLHLSGAFHAMRDGVLIQPEALSQDIRRFFSLPIPSYVWERLKPLQDRAFIAFVGKARG